MGCEHPDWLPVGWKVTVKARNSGKKDKYYVNLSNGLKFKSMPEVLRYLKVPRKDRQAKDPVMNPVKVDIRKSAADKLPSGWIKEIRTKKKHGRTRRDPTYIDPVSGRHFRSMQEVFRYLESKDVRKTNSKQDNTKLRRRPQSAPSETKEQTLIGKIADENFSGRSSLKSGSKPASGRRGAATKNVNTPEEREVPLAVEFSDKLQKVKRRSDRLREIRELMDDKGIKLADKDQMPKLGVVNENKQCIDGRRKSKRLADIQLKDNVIAKRCSIESGSKGSEEKNIKSRNKRESSKRKWAGDLPRRTSPRFARVDTNPSSEVKTSNNGQADVSNTKSISKAESSHEPEVDLKEKSSSRSNDSKELPPKSKLETPTNDQQKKPITPGDQKYIRFEHKETAAHEKHPVSTLDNLLTDPCIEFAIKTLTGVIPIEEVTKLSNSPASSLALPIQTPASSSTFGVWTDPCFEFAVKTVTGEKPAQFQITFQQPFSSQQGGGQDGYDSRAALKLRSDNIYTMKQSSNQLGAVEKSLVQGNEVKGSH